MTITEIQLEGFGPYSNLTVPMGQLTLVTSSSPDTGKSWAVERSLNWCIFNAGPAFNADDAKDEVRHQKQDGAKVRQVRVRVTFSDGSYVERTRSSSVNAYTIRDRQGNLHEYSSPGSGFFQPVSDHLGIQPVALDGKNPEVVNIQGFHEPPFLLGRSPAQIDTILSRLMGADVIEDGGALAAADLRISKQALKVLEQQQAENQQALSALPDLARAGTLLGDAASASCTSEKLREHHQAIFQAHHRAETAATSVFEHQIVVQPLQELIPQINNEVNRAVNSLRLCSDYEKFLAASQRVATISSCTEACATLAQQAAASLKRAEVCRSTTALLDRSQRAYARSTSIEEEIVQEQETVRHLEHMLLKVNNAQEQAQGLRERAKLLHTATVAVKRTQMRLGELTLEAGRLDGEVEWARLQFEQGLQEAGVCSLCGQSTNDIHVCLEGQA